MPVRHVFIVDDDPIAVMIMKRLIAKSDFHPSPMPFENGLTVLNHLKGIYTPADQYVIFLDINMPVMNGWEFLDAITDFADTGNTIVFLVTSSTDEADRVRSEQYSLVARYLSKPVSVAALEELKGSVQ
ncbi:hypothetical protein FLJC2902T_29910 [Flavobacterium limnosediminis JC2902]|uniref:Response regulatory domain-containing protein n=1 Tax=Flavobacterium limnosediminis JC2902 TaxID=1341181 RepID=V6SGY9_9FLAO|nr:response regulator [Flavobacterium limnosediminis]ESU25978.1 hypothetical protein FLJC2902T_29910 [Flavobacterium limnosediminis JC2902]